MMECCSFGTYLTLTLITGCLGLLYIYGKRRNRFLKDAGFPGPEPTIFVGNLLTFMKDGMDLKNQEKMKQYGKVFGTFLGGIPFVNVGDADILREILIKDFPNFSDRLVFELDNYPMDLGIFSQRGAAWKRLRNIISPTFSGNKLRKMCDHLNLCAKKLTRNLEGLAKEGKPVQMKEPLGAFTMDAIATTAFGIDINAQDNFENSFIREMKKIFDRNFFQSPVIFFVVLFPGLTSLFRKLGFSTFPSSSLKFFRSSLRKIVDDRRAESAESTKNRVDFLQLMLNAESDDAQETSEKKMSTDEIMGQAFLFFLAGYETTATTLFYVTYILATHPEVQQKLREEVRDVIGESDPDYDNVHKLDYMDRVITESLRLYPTVPGLSRYVSKTTTIKGWTFPEGAYINVPALMLHRDPDVYPEPDVFMPERWEQKSDIDAMTYVPFGHGPRQCIGMRLAQVEMKIALIHVIRRIHFEALPETPEKLTQFNVGGALMPKHPVKIGLKLYED